VIEVVELKTNFKPVGNLDEDRNELRKVVINKFLKEKPGTGRGKKGF